MLTSGSCIPYLDTEPCDTPIEKLVGYNDKFLITPLKSNYSVGDTINVIFIVNNSVKLEDNVNIDYDLFGNTMQKRGTLFGFENNQDLANLIYTSSNFNSIKFINGQQNQNGGYDLVYNSNLNKYILELEITLKTARSYNINDFSFTLLLGNKSNNKNRNCHFYKYSSSIIINPTISFEVK